MACGRGILACATLGLFVMTSFLAFPSLGDQDQSRLTAYHPPGFDATGNPPTFRIFLPADISSNKGDVVSFIIYVQDVDDDTINVTWDFGDGSPFGMNTTAPAATTQVVRTTHVYEPYYPGQGADFPFDGPFTVNYSINVTLHDGNGNGVWRNTTRVHVNLPWNEVPATPTVSGPTQGVDPMDPVVITASSSDPEGDELWWTYFFNDSVTDANYFVKTNHTSRTAPGVVVWTNQSVIMGVEGNFSVTVFVCDAPIPYQRFPHNLSDEVTVRVVYNVAPLASEITSDPTNPVLDLGIGFVTVTYYIDAVDQDGDVMTVTWDFGDGSPLEVNASAGGTIVYQFSQRRDYTDEGTFLTNVTVADGRSGHEVEKNVSVTVTILNYRPIPSFTVDPPYGNIFDLFSFDASACSDDWTPSSQLEVRWDFDNDGVWDTDWTTVKTIDHQFTSPGKYTVVLEVRDGSGLTNTTSLRVQVDLAVPEFPVLPLVVILAGLVLVLSKRAISARDRPRP